MKILIISNFSTRIESDRFVYIGEILSRRGHQVTLLTSDFNHDQKEHIQNVENCQLYKTSIILLHEPGYPKNVSVKRLWSHYVWGRNVKRYLKSIEKPDVVYVAMGSPKQEFLMAEMMKLHPAIYQGLGGSFDVYTGRVKRAPLWWQKHNLEFLYRFLKQPQRYRREYYRLKFLFWLMIGKFK